MLIASTSNDPWQSPMAKARSRQSPKRVAKKKADSTRKTTTRTAGAGKPPNRVAKRSASVGKRPGSVGKRVSAVGKRTSGVGGRARKTPAAIRSAIDRIDRELLREMDRRAKLVKELGKLEAGQMVGRVTEATRRIRAVAASDSASSAIPGESKVDVLRHIASICLEPLHALRVAYLGPLHSYSHLAAIKFFGEGSNLAPVASIPAVFDAVTRHDASCGVVPIENSTDGRVVDTLGMFVRRRMQICGEVLLPIHHQLLSRTPREEILEVYSKPQALSQCRGWLANQLPQAKLVEISSTAAAARLAAEKPGAAAVASLEAGREYELDVIDANIEDNPNNVTRFAVLGREQPERTGDDKTAILFQVRHQPGALADTMTIFKRGGLNLTWIESFPKPEKPNEYLFFVELTGHRDDQSVTVALAALEKQAERVEVLGSYPRAELTS